MNDLRAALAPVCRPVSGIWERWAAVQYLEREFIPRFERETEEIGRFTDRLGQRQASRVWATAELVNLLTVHLIELVSLAQSGALFAASAEKLIRAHECWCGEVAAAREPLARATG